MTNIVLAAQAAQGGGMSMIIMMVAIFAIMYFFMIRPQQKEQKEKTAMMSALEIGDTVLTTSGFYGVVIAIPDDTTVIVEFGSNKNCRIPMQKVAIAQIEKPEDAVKATKEEDKKEKTK